MKGPFRTYCPAAEDAVEIFQAGGDAGAKTVSPRNMNGKTMSATRNLFVAGLAACLALPASAEVSQETIEALGAPERMETRVGTLEFKDGAPTAETAQTVFDTLDFTRALNVYNNSFRGASALGLQKGFQSIGADFNDVVITSELLDSTSLFLTGNADTVYYLSTIDLSKGPMVIEQPSDAVGTINDMWFSWIIDIGKPGPDRGLGGKYLIVGPDYDGPLPEGGYFVAHSKTNRVLYASRAYLVDNDPKPAIENVKANLKIYPYTRGRLRHQHRRGPDRRGPSGGGPEDPRDEVRRGERRGVQHDPAQRFRFLSSGSTKTSRPSRPPAMTWSSPDSLPPSASSRARSSRPTSG